VARACSVPSVCGSVAPRLASRTARDCLSRATRVSEVPSFALSVWICSSLTLGSRTWRR
jgi:hypothetical protein